MKNIIIIGNGSYAKMMNKYIDIINYGCVVSYAVDEAYIDEEHIGGIPVISFEKMRELYNPLEVQLIMGIGYTQMGKVRKRVFKECKTWGYSFANYIHPTAIISPDVIMGEGNNILEGVIVEVGVEIGDANLFFGGSMIGHESIVGNFNTFAGKSITAGCVQIKDNCFFGVSAALKDHVKVSNYAFLGATAYGYKDIEEYAVVIPAKSEILKDKKSTDYL